MTIPDLRRKLVSILAADEGCTDAQLLEVARLRMKERQVYKDLHAQRPAYTSTWAHVQLGQMVVTERGSDAGLAVWMLAGRQRDGSEVDKMLFVKIIDPKDEPEVMWLDKKREDTVTVLDLPGMGHGTQALGELGS